MNKKLLALILSVAVVASIAAAGTLAYLTADAGKVTNNFTVGTETGKGNIDVTLDEIDIDGEEGARTTEGNSYTDVFPGSTLPKDPTLHVGDESEDCWIFVGVKNDAPELLSIMDSDPNRMLRGLVDENDEPVVVNGYTIYVTVQPQKAGSDIVVFNGVKVSPAATNDDIETINDSTIKVAGFAIQAANIDTRDDAVTAGWTGTEDGEGSAKAYFEKLDVTTEPQA